MTMIVFLLLGCFLSPVIAAGSSLDDDSKKSGMPSFHPRSRTLQSADNFCAVLLEDVAAKSPALTCTCTSRIGGGYTSVCSLAQVCGSYEDIALTAFGLDCTGNFCYQFTVEIDYREDGTISKNEAIYDISGDTDYESVNLVTEFPIDGASSYSAFVSVFGSQYQCQSYDQCSSTFLDLFDCSNIQIGAVMDDGCPGGGFFFQKFSLCPVGGAMTPTTDPVVVLAPPTLCFSGDSEVEVEGKGPIKMNDLLLGDSVKVDNENYEAVYSFGHKNDVVSAAYLQIATDQAKTRPLTISKDHMVFVGGARNAVPASMLKVGDILTTHEGERATVQSIRNVVRKGAFAPFTASGTIVVDGVIASNYIAYQDSARLKLGGVTTPLSYQWMGHTFESAHRLAFKMGIRDETYTQDGISRWVDLPHKFGEWLFAQNSFIVITVLAPVISIFGLFSLIEKLTSLEWATTALLGAAVALRLCRSRKGCCRKR